MQRFNRLAKLLNKLNDRAFEGYRAHRFAGSEAGWNRARKYQMWIDRVLYQMRIEAIKFAEINALVSEGASSVSVNAEGRRERSA